MPFVIYNRIDCGFKLFLRSERENRHELLEILWDFVLSDFLVEVLRYRTKVIREVVQIRNTLPGLSEMLEVKEVEKLEDLHLGWILDLRREVEYTVEELLAICVVEVHQSKAGRSYENVTLSAGILSRLSA